MVAGLLVACTVEPEPGLPPPAEFAQLCGEAGPVRILRFEPWRRVSTAGHWVRFDDRRLLVVNFEDSAAAPTALWSVGPCGEDPRLLVSGRFNLRILPSYDLPFVCEPLAGRLSVVDPSGELASRPVFETGGDYCHAVYTDAGLVSVRPDAPESGTGSLILQPWPADIWTDPIEAVIIHDRVKLPRSSAGVIDWSVVQADAGGVFVLSSDDELVYVTVPGGEVELIATGVHRFELSRDLDGTGDRYARRYLLWQGIEVSNGDPEDPEAEIQLLDRATQQLWSLGHGGLQRMMFGGLRWVDQGLVPLRVEVEGELVLRLFRLPSLDFVDVDGALEPRYLLGGGRHLLVQGGGSPWEFLDLQTGDWWVPPVPMSFSFWWDRRGATALLEDGQLYWLSGDEPPELIARRADHRHVFLPDGRLLTGVDVNESGLGDLIVVDPVTLEERLVVRGVSVMLAGSVWSEDESLVGYTVLDGDRSGLWLARLRPRD